MTAANKAIVGFIFGFLTSLVAQIQDKTSFGDLTSLQWLVVVVSAVVTSGAIYLTPNAPKAP